MATVASQRQSIPVLRDAPSPDTDEVAKLLALFDHALDHHRAIVAMCASVPGARRDYSALVSISGKTNEYAEYAARLWCSANQLTWNETVHEYAAGTFADDGNRSTTIRAVRVVADLSDLIRITWPYEVVITPAAVIEALHRPDDATLTDEERAQMERLEAGHA